MERRGPGGFGLRRPVLAGLVEEEACRSSPGGRTLTMLTSGGAVAGGRMPAVLPRRCSMRACCCCLMLIMDRTCSRALGSSSRIVKPMTTGEMPLSTEGLLTSVLIPGIVIRRFFDGLGDADVEGGVWFNSRSRCFWSGGGTVALEGGSESSTSCFTLTTGLGDRRLYWPSASPFSPTTASECNRFRDICRCS